MKYAFVFVSFAAMAGVAAWAIHALAARVLLAWVAVAFLGVGLAYAALGPGVFLKRADGRVGVLGQLVIWPYHALNHVMLRLYRRTTGESLFDEIVPGVVLGARPLARDEVRLAPLGVAAVLDLTSEFHEPAFLRRGPDYLCIPVLDATAPSSDDLRRAVAWLRARRSDGTVYVHCAMGHGRSATVVAALLIVEELAPDAAAAEDTIRAQRPGAGLNTPQRAALTAFAAE